MPKTAQQVLEAANAAIDRGDHEGFLAFCTDDTVWTFVGDRTLRGKDEVRAWMDEVYVEPPRNLVERMIATSDSVVALGEIVTIEHGQEVSRTYCDVWQLREGRLAELRAFVI